jgi:hypothetical protein
MTLDENGDVVIALPNNAAQMGVRTGHERTAPTVVIARPVSGFADDPLAALGLAWALP